MQGKKACIVVSYLRRCLLASLLYYFFTSEKHNLFHSFHFRCWSICSNSLYFYNEKLDPKLIRHTHSWQWQIDPYNLVESYIDKNSSTHLSIHTFIKPPLCTWQAYKYLCALKRGKACQYLCAINRGRPTNIE